MPDSAMTDQQHRSVPLVLCASPDDPEAAGVPEHAPTRHRYGEAQRV